jgi:hypothetical protein
MGRTPDRCVFQYPQAALPVGSRPTDDFIQMAKAAETHIVFIKATAPDAR